MRQLRMLDLFCGRAGWTKGFLSEGWECVGVDLNPQPDYPAEFVQADVLSMWAGADGSFYISERDDGGPLLWEYFPDFVCGSSPCEQFSVHGMRCFFPNPPHPDQGIRLFNHTQKMLQSSGRPYVMENVRAAQKFVGRATNHCGPYYLWGSGVPAVMPKELYAVIKGMTRKALGHYDYKGQPGWNTKNERQRKRGTQQECASVAAEIPIEISRYIAQCAGNLVAEGDR